MGSTPNPDAKTRAVTKPPKRGPGRPSKLTAKLRAQVVELIGEGQFAVDACAAVGIGVSTFMSWKAKGEGQAKGQYRDFLSAIEGAEATRRRMLMTRVSTASKEAKHWQAAAWVLTHTDPGKFAPQLRVHVEGELNSALDRLEQEFKNEPETWARILAAIAGGARVPAPAGISTGERSSEHAAGSSADSPRGVTAPT